MCDATAVLLRVLIRLRSLVRRHCRRGWLDRRVTCLIHTTIWLWTVNWVPMPDHTLLGWIARYFRWAGWQPSPSVVVHSLWVFIYFASCYFYFDVSGTQCHFRTALLDFCWANGSGRWVHNMSYPTIKSTPNVWWVFVTDRCARKAIKSAWTESVIEFSRCKKRFSFKCF